MYKRKRMPYKRDRAVYSNTAVKGKAVNGNSRVARGGIRI